jgi:hypothetical protein
MACHHTSSCIRPAVKKTTGETTALRTRLPTLPQLPIHIHTFFHLECQCRPGRGHPARVASRGRCRSLHRRQAILVRSSARHTHLQPSKSTSVAAVSGLSNKLLLRAMHPLSDHMARFWYPFYFCHLFPFENHLLFVYLICKASRLEAYMTTLELDFKS